MSRAPRIQDVNLSKPSVQKLLKKIALDHCFVETLQTRNSDRLDFHDVSVWGLQSALEAAYQAGLEAGSFQKLNS